jgi:hypothetical protein
MTRNTKIGLTVAALVLALFAGSYLMSSKPGAGATGNTELPSNTPAHTSVKTGPGLPLPDPAGPAGAPAKVVVYMRGGDQCQMPTVRLVTDVTALYPGKIRIIYRNTALKAVQKEAEQKKIACQVALFINGENSFTIPGHGKYGAVTLNSPPGHEFNQADLIAVLDKVLTAKGVDVAALKASVPQSVRDAANAGTPPM